MYEKLEHINSEVYQFVFVASVGSFCKVDDRPA